MRSAQVDELKLELFDRLGVLTAGAVSAQAFATGRWPIPGVALGKTKKGRSFQLAVVASQGHDPKHLQKIRRAAAGELEVVKLGVCEPRITSNWSKQPHDPGEIGQQVGPLGQPWVGTGSMFMRAAAGRRQILQLTNEHVVGLGAPKGRMMHQGGRQHGPVYATGGIDLRAMNPVDCGSIAMLDGYDFFPAWDHGLKGEIRSVRSPNEDDLGQRATETGQTEGTLYGTLWAIDLDNQPVAFDRGIGYFENMTVWVGEDGRPFSVPGHSGAVIIMLHDRAAVAHLNAGGRDSSGVDRTLALDLPASMMAAGGLPEVL